MNQDVRRKSLKKDIAQIDKELDAYMDRIVEASSSTVVRALERKIETLEDEKRLKEEVMGKLGAKRPPFENAFRTALAFLENPRHAWDSGDITLRKDVLKLTFADRLRYCQKGGLRALHH